MAPRTTQRRRNLLLGTCILLALAGCGGKGATVPPGAQAPAAAAAPAEITLSCVAVLPTTTVVNRDGKVRFEDAKALEDGARAVDDLLPQLLARSKVPLRFLTARQLEGILGDASLRPLAQARAVGRQVSCNGVLSLTMKRYTQRVGGNYSVDQPASVAFSYSLLATDSGQTLCRGEFDETQASLLENLFAIDKASSRGFQWVTAEALLREGLTERLGDCRYLAED